MHPGAHQCVAAPVVANETRARTIRTTVTATVLKQGIKQAVETIDNLESRRSSINRCEPNGSTTTNIDATEHKCEYAVSAWRAVHSFKIVSSHPSFGIKHRSHKIKKEETTTTALTRKY